MSEKSYQDAVQALKNRLTGRWEGVEANGRDEMVSILKEELGYDDREAHDVIDALIESGQLRYHRAVGAADTGDVAPLPVVPIGAAGISSASPAGVSGTPIVPAAVVAGGYWEIDPGDSGVPGRAGQVDPTA